LVGIQSVEVEKKCASLVERLRRGLARQWVGESEWQVKQDPRANDK
jgi:hypothetical protein